MIVMLGYVSLICSKKKQLEISKRDTNHLAFGTLGKTPIVQMRRKYVHNSRGGLGKVAIIQELDFEWLYDVSLLTGTPRDI